MRTVYAIAFDLDTSALSAAYPGPSWNNGYEEVRKELAKHGFSRAQGSVYFGDETVTAVTCVVAVQRTAAAIPWFAGSVRDIRMLRIEANNDLSPALPSPDVAPEKGGEELPAELAPHGDTASK